MGIVVPTYEEFQALSDRVTALESGHPPSSPGQSVLIERTPKGAERHEHIPVTTGYHQEWRNIMQMEVQNVVAGESWLAFAEYHGTNRDLRSRGHGVTFVHELRAGGEFDTDDRDGLPLNEDSGGQNVSVKAHHDYRVVPGYIVWPEAHERVCLKFMGKARGTQCIEGDTYQITPNRGYIYLLRIRPAGQSA